MMKFLINASNLHVGGGVQVATSLITELCSLADGKALIHVIASSAVDQNLRAGNVPVRRFASYSVNDTRGLTALLRSTDFLRGYDSILTVFGPLYCWKSPAPSVVGFAQPWIIYPDNEVSQQLSWLTRLRVRLKYWVQSKFFSRADYLVVELEHVREGLIRKGIAPPENIRVVSNTLSSLYFDPSLWRPIGTQNTVGKIKLGFLGRNYPHKNTAIFPLVRDHLKTQHGLDVIFYVTFTPEEWSNCSRPFRDSCVNIGALQVSQCPGFYESVDGVVFPSLLECFSATPLEAMAMRKPLFASNRPFIRDVCGNHAYYFDPLDASSIANCIAEYFRSQEIRTSELDAAREHAMSFSNPSHRAKEYLACLYEAAGTIHGK